MKKVVVISALCTLLICSSCGTPLPAHLTVTFKGIVMNGLKYSQPFGRIFRFELVPKDGEYIIRVADIRGKEDLSVPPLSDNSDSRYLKISHVAGLTPAEKKQASRAGAPFRREFTFLPAGTFATPPEPGKGVFTLIDYSLTDTAEKKFKWLQFECTLTWKEWDRAASQP